MRAIASADPLADAIEATRQIREAQETIARAVDARAFAVARLRKTMTWRQIGRKVGVDHTQLFTELKLRAPVMPVRGKPCGHRG